MQGKRLGSQKEKVLLHSGDGGLSRGKQGGEGKQRFVFGGVGFDGKPDRPSRVNTEWQHGHTRTDEGMQSDTWDDGDWGIQRRSC